MNMQAFFQYMSGISLFKTFFHLLLKCTGCVFTDAWSHAYVSEVVFLTSEVLVHMVSNCVGALERRGLSLRLERK